jgi:hypothetical protein
MIFILLMSYIKELVGALPLLEVSEFSVSHRRKIQNLHVPSRPGMSRIFVQLITESHTTAWCDMSWRLIPSNLMRCFSHCRDYFRQRGCEMRLGDVTG